jgi:hypothetical protein
MKAKDDINILLSEVKNKIADHLSINDVVNFAITSKINLEFFKPIANARKLTQFLHELTRGNHEAVRTMLAKDNSLFYRKGKVTDCSGRTFENISGFEYALWALDKHMWTAILDCIPQDQEGNKIRQLLKGQYDNLDKKSITYILNGETITEQHFDFENTIIKELQMQINMINAVKEKVINIYSDAKKEDLNAISKQWCEDVRRAQKLFPMHVVYEYCSDELFSSEPEFISQPNSSTKIFNCLTNEYENWFSVDSEQESWSFSGKPVAIYRSLAAQRGQKGACAGSDCFTQYWASNDLSFIQKLYRVRTNDFINLKSQLEEQMTLDNYHQVVSM